MADSSHKSDKVNNVQQRKVINVAADGDSVSTEARNTATKDKKIVDYDFDVHDAQESLLSNSSGFNNYRGFLNLCIVLLAMTSGRLVLENIIKYGILVDPIQWVAVFLKDPHSWPNLTLAICLNYFVLFSFGIEKITLKHNFSQNIITVFCTCNCLTVIVFPVIVINVIRPNPVGASIVLGMYAITFMKLVSYHIVNKWCRQIQTESKKHDRAPTQRDRGKSPHQSPRKRRSHQYPAKGSSWEVGEASSEKGQYGESNGSAEAKELSEVSYTVKEYPDNINLKDMYYFMCVPTLCYDLNFPRTARVRKRFLVRRIIELVFLVQLSLCLIQQWIVPLVNNAMKPFGEMDVSRIIERVLKLAVPNHFIWLCFFYFFFHSYLNILAEILRFADREFYRDWWNSETVGYFWRNWNIPVHKWARRHVYKPLRRRGYSPLFGQVAVFVLSALFHEYLVSVPLHMFKVWAFGGMMLQIPLAFMVSTFFKKSLGNMMVWLILIIGQPVAVLMYVHDYYVINYITLTATNETAT